MTGPDRHTPTVGQVLSALGIRIGADELEGRWGVYEDFPVHEDLFDRALAIEQEEEPWND